MTVSPTARWNRALAEYSAMSQRVNMNASRLDQLGDHTLAMEASMANSSMASSSMLALPPPNSGRASTAAGTGKSDLDDIANIVSDVEAKAADEELEALRDSIEQACKAREATCREHSSTKPHRKEQLTLADATKYQPYAFESPAKPNVISPAKVKSPAVMLKPAAKPAALGGGSFGAKPASGGSPAGTSSSFGAKPGLAAGAFAAKPATVGAATGGFAAAGKAASGFGGLGAGKPASSSGAGFGAFGSAAKPASPAKPSTFGGVGLKLDIPKMGLKPTASTTAAPAAAPAATGGKPNTLSLKLDTSAAGKVMPAVPKLGGGSGFGGFASLTTTDKTSPAPAGKSGMAKPDFGGTLPKPTVTTAPKGFGAVPTAKPFGGSTSLKPAASNLVHVQIQGMSLGIAVGQAEKGKPGVSVTKIQDTAEPGVKQKLQLGMKLVQVQGQSVGHMATVKEVVEVIKAVAERPLELVFEPLSAAGGASWAAKLLCKVLTSSSSACSFAVS